MKTLLTLILTTSYVLLNAQLPDLTFLTNGASITNTPTSVTINITFTNQGNATSPTTEAMPYITDQSDDNLLDYSSAEFFYYPNCSNTSPIFIPSLSPGQTFSTSTTINICEFQYLIEDIYHFVGIVIDWENNIIEIDDNFDQNSALFQTNFDFGTFNCPCRPDTPCFPYSAICTNDYTPVCGCNNVTYSNACYAQADAVQSYTPGECSCDNYNIECGETLTLSNVNSGNNNLTASGCTSNNLNANDLIISFERYSAWSTSWITLYNPGNANLNLYLFDQCPTNGGEISPTCLSSSQNGINCNHNYDAIEVSGYPAGTYYILIDGFSSSALSNDIELHLSCESLNCSDAEELSCNTPVIRSNAGYYNQLSAYYNCYQATSNACFNYQGSWYGGERIFKFTAPENGNYTFCMDPLNNIDLELFLFDACCTTTYEVDSELEIITDFGCFDNCSKAATNPSGQAEQIPDYYMNAGDMVWLIVDGFLGDEGNFEIEVKCDIFNCDDSFNITCQTPSFIDSNHPNSNAAPNTKVSDNFDSHNLCINAIDGCKTGSLSTSAQFAEPEVVYHFNTQNNIGNDLVIDIFPKVANLDVDLFVYEDCTSAGLFDCERTSTWGSQADDSVIIKDLGSNDEYYIVVDGQSNSNNQVINVGEYKFSLTCGKIEDHQPIILECDSSIEGDTRTSFNSISHYCNCPEDTNRTGGGNDGNELVYQFFVEQTSDVNILLEDYGNNNLELYLLNDLSINACYANSRTTSSSEQIQKQLPPGTYYIIVEGHDGDEGQFKLTLTGCGNFCDYTKEIFCEDFENYNSGQNISSQSINWYPSVIRTFDEDCKVASQNNNNYLSVSTNGSNVCSSGLKLPDTNDNIIELSFNLFMPYYNFGQFPLQADGSEIFIFEEDENSQNSIYLAFRPHSSDTQNDDRRVQLLIGNDLILDEDLVRFIRNGTNTCKIRLYKSNGTITVSVNGSIIGSASNTGMVNLGMIAFGSVFNNNAGYRVDNICLHSCEICDTPSVHVTDTEIQPCSYIHLQNVTASSNNISAQFNSTLPNGFSIDRWELIDLDSGTIIDSLQENTIYDYCCWLPGRRYIICLWYFDEYGCLKRCCKEYYIPIDCDIILPTFSGDENSVNYDMTASLSNNESVVDWFSSDTQNSLGQSTSINYIPIGFGQRYICCLVYNSFLNQYILCCKLICVENPYACNNINYTFDELTNSFTLIAPTGTSNIMWYLDAPTQAIIGFNNPQQFNPLDFNIPFGSDFQISYRYIDQNGCYKFCCRRINFPQPTDPVIVHIGEACGAIGALVDIPVSVTNFNDLAQGTLIFELSNNFARIVDIELVSLPPNLGSNSFSDQKMIVSWLSQNGQGISLPDESIVFNIIVEIIGNNLTLAELNLVNNPTISQFANSMAVPVSTNGIPGEVCLAEDLIILGSISDKNLLPVSQVDVYLSGSTNEQTTTDNEGRYTFSVQANNLYDVQPLRDGDDNNGVNGIDLLILQQHILFVNTLDSAYDLIAADLNNDGQVNGLDLLILQRQILFVTPAFEFVDSWTFVDKDHVFSTSNPDIQNYPTSLTYNPILGSDENADFIAIKKGDLNQDANKSQMGKEDIYKTNCHKLKTEDIDLTADEEFIMTFTSDQFNNIAVFLIELDYDPTELSFIQFDRSDLNGFSNGNIGTTFQEQGQVLISWVTPTGEGVNLNSQDAVFQLKFKAHKTGKLSDMIQIGNMHVSSEVTTIDFESDCIELIFQIMSNLESDNLTHPYTFETYPNPVLDRVLIKSDPQFKMSSIKIYSIDGSLIFKQNLASHFTEYHLDLENLDTGIYIIQIHNDTEILSQRIVKY